jgi:hypothetical protein
MPLGKVLLKNLLLGLGERWNPRDPLGIVVQCYQ